MDTAIALVVASEFERRMVQKGVSTSQPPALDSEVIVVNCGVGFCDTRPLAPVSPNGCVISTGFAAGLRPGIETGAILMPETLIGEDGLKRQIDFDCFGKLGRSIFAGQRVTTAPLLETTEILGTPSAKASAEHHYGAAGADMESSRIAQYCARRGLDFLVLRVVLDPANASVPQSIIDTTVDGKVPGPLTLAASLALQPADWAAFLALLRYVRVARRALIKTLAEMVPVLLESREIRDDISTDTP